MDFLSDAGWVAVLVGIIGVIIGIIAIIVSIYLARPKKSLAFEVISDYPLVSIRDEIRERLKILLDDKLVENVQLLTISIVNNGKIPIVVADYERPISIIFDDDVEVLSTDIVEAKPINLNPLTKVNNNHVIINPFLINSGDYIVLKITVLEYKNSFKFDARIAGVNEVQRLTRSNVPLLAGEIFFEALGVAIGVALSNPSSRRRIK